MEKYEKFKHEVLAGAIWLAESGYLGKRSSGGNISIRIPNESILAITPSGKSYLQLDVNDICIMDFNGKTVDGRFAPSIEARMHIGVYEIRDDVNAVIHTHQTFASVLAAINKPIPALFDEIIVEIGHEVAMIPYAFSGTSELVRNVTRQLGNACHCYIIQNHGALSLGADMDRALKNVELLENVAKIYYYALTTGETVTTLPEDAIAYFSEMRKLRFSS